MLRLALLAIALLAVRFPTMAAEPGDTKAVDGVWVLEKAEMDSKDITALLKQYVLKLDNGKYTLDDLGRKDEGTIKIDVSKSPKQMDIIGGPTSPFKGKTFPCIYDVKEGKLIVCYGMDFETRPTEFKTSPESKRMLAVYIVKK